MFFKLLSWEEKNEKVLCYIMAKVGNLPKIIFLLVRSIGRDLVMYQIDGYMLLIFVGFSNLFLFFMVGP